MNNQTTALSKAFTDAERSYLAAKAASPSADKVLAEAPSGRYPFTSANFGLATEQLQHFSGWSYACIKAIAQRICGQTIHVGQEKRVATGQGVVVQREPLASHPLIDLLTNPNDLMTSWGLMYTTIASMELTGYSLWWLPDQENIFPLPSSWLLRIQGDSEIEGFWIRPEGTAEETFLPRDECCFFHYPHPAGLKQSWSPLQAAALAVTADESIQTSQVKAFQNGMFPTHVVTVGREPNPTGGSMRPRLSGPQQNQIINAIRRRYSGVMRSGEPLILDGLIESVQRLSSTNEEMAFKQSGEITKQRIMQSFGCNPVLLGELENANRASAIAADLHFVQVTINPKIQLLSQVMTEYLSPMFPNEVEVWIEPAVPNDSDDKFRKADLAARNGVLTANELRKFCGFEAVEMFEGVFAGMNQQNSLQRAFENLVDGRISGIAADSILDSISLTRDLDTHKSNGHAISR